MAFLKAGVGVVEVASMAAKALSGMNSVEST